MFEVQGKVVGTDAQLPATLTGPSDGKMFVDAPLLKWNAVNWADSYKVVLSVDRDFTTEVGHYYTTNTRLIPLERIPEDNARSYFWYVVPCRFVDSGGLTAASLTAASPDAFPRTGSSIALEPIVHSRNTLRNPGPNRPISRFGHGRASRETIL